MRKKKVLVAMSGGVDSSAAAALLVQQGYRLIVIVNGHGAWGQTSTLERLAVEFSNETPSKVIVGFPTIAREGETIDFGHACDVETSLMQYLTDGCVDLSQLPPRDVKLKYTDWGIADKCVVRDPRDAAPEKGEQFFQVALEHLCKRVTDAYQHL